MIDDSNILMQGYDQKLSEKVQAKEASFNSLECLPLEFPTRKSARTPKPIPNPNQPIEFIKSKKQIIIDEVASEDRKM